VRRLAWRGVRNNLGRYVATLVAIITGVGFFTATGFVSDRVIRSLEGDVDRQYSNVDVAVVLEDESTDDLSGNPGKDLKISQEQASRILAVRGLAGSAGELSAPVAFPPRPGRPGTKAATGRLWPEDAELNPVELESGRARSRTGDIAVDRGLAKSEKLKLGSKLKVATLAGQFDATVVGITKFGDSDAQDQDGTVSVPRAAAFDWLNSGHEEYQSLFLRGSIGQDELAAEVKPLAPSGSSARRRSRSSARWASRGCSSA